jgi:hypothetical protein
MEILPLTIGCDPEGFLFHKKKKKFVSAHGIIPGTKSAPHKVDKGAVQVDGMAAEFNIDPASTREQFVDHVTSVISTLSSMLPKDVELKFQPVATFDAETWAEVPPEAKELGCDPDFNAYTGEANPRPDGARDFRTAAGHIHLGWTKGMAPDDPGHIEACRMMARQLDFYLGLPLLLCDPDPTRRTMYGKAGAYRVKPYGVEYRTPSNVWVNNPEMMAWVFDRAKDAFEALFKGDDKYDLYKEYARIVIDEDFAKPRPTIEDIREVKVVTKIGLELPLPPVRAVGA